MIQNFILTGRPMMTKYIKLCCYMNNNNNNNNDDGDDMLHVWSDKCTCTVQYDPHNADSTCSCVVICYNFMYSCKIGSLGRIYDVRDSGVDFLWGKIRNN